jgi:hypothetical protein
MNEGLVKHETSKSCRRRVLVNVGDSPCDGGGMIGEVQVAQGNMVGIQGRASGRLARQRVSRSQVSGVQRELVN